MIDSFFSSWELFHNVYLAGWLIGLVLSLLGVLVVAKDQIFIGAAVSQASGLGVALAMWVGASVGASHHDWVQSEWFLSAMAVTFSIAAAVITSQTGRGRESQEAITGWVFLTASSFSILIVSKTPHGLDEIQRLVSSSIIGATATDVWTFAALAVTTVVALVFANRRLLLLTVDQAMAAATGMRTGLWSAAYACWLGLTIGLAIPVSGMLYAFGFLVLPALIAKHWCREVRPMFVISPLIALVSGLFAFVFANHYDFPPGQMAVALLVSLLAATWLSRLVRR